MLLKPQPVGREPRSSLSWRSDEQRGRSRSPQRRPDGRIRSPVR
jgi:hypothetical protein